MIEDELISYQFGNGRESMRRSMTHLAGINVVRLRYYNATYLYCYDIISRSCYNIICRCLYNHDSSRFPNIAFSNCCRHLEVEKLLCNRGLEFIGLSAVGLHNFLAAGKHDYFCGRGLPWIPLNTYVTCTTTVIRPDGCDNL